MGDRILVSYVGNNDPYGKTDPKTGEPTTGPILSILDHLQAEGRLPDRTILLVTESHDREFPLLDGGTARHRQDGMEAQAKKVREAIAARYSPPITVQEVPLRVNPADLDEVIEATLKGLKGQINPEDEVHINVSSGTPAMSAAIVFLADSGHILCHFVWQSLDPTKLPSRACRIKQVNLAYLSEGDRLSRALSFLQSMAFAYAEEAFRELERNTFIFERRPKAEASAKLMEAYTLWDHASFGKALKALEEAEQAFERLGGWGRILHLEEQLKVLEQVARDCQTGRETQAILEDMYAAIERKARSGQLINLPTRARRLYEGILNFLLYESGLEASDWEELGEKMKELWDLAAEGQLTLLGSDEDEQKEKLKMLKARYNAFSGARNQSYEVHGLGGISESLAKETLDAVREMMRLIFPESRLAGHPFSPQALDKLAQGLRAWFGP